MDINGMEDALRIGCTVRLFCIEGVMTAAYVKRETAITSLIGRRDIRRHAAGNPLYRWLVDGNIIEIRKDGEEVVLAAKRLATIEPPGDVLEEITQTGEAQVWDRGDIMYRTTPEMTTIVVYAPTFCRQHIVDPSRQENTAFEARGVDIIEAVTRLSSSLA